MKMKRLTSSDMPVYVDADVHSVVHSVVHYNQISPTSS
jgi:hypothetical protein